MINLVIPMAGRSSSFMKEGITTPKPFIDVKGKTMVQRAFESINLMPYAQPIFVVLKEHDTKYEAQKRILDFCPYAKFVIIDEITSGPAETVYKAKELINNDDELIQTNVDQILDWDSDRFLLYTSYEVPDGAVITVETTDPHYSFIKVDYKGKAVKLAEKEVISKRGLIGTHYWMKGSDFIWSYEVAKQKGVNYKGELYISQTYNELIEAGKNIRDYRFLKNEYQHPVGDPEQLKKYVESI